MKGTRAGVIFVLAGLLLVGCRPHGLDAYNKYKLGPARRIVGASVEWLGGIDAWENVQKIRISAVVVIHDKQAGAYLNRHTQVIDLPAGKITATAKLPKGSWKATVDRSGRGNIRTTGLAIDPATAAKIKSALATLLHRMCGPLNLLGQDERPHGVQATRLRGIDVIRVRVTGSETDVIAYYFDAINGELKFVTAGADRPGGDGTVTVFEEYVVLPNGMYFPRKMRVMAIGEHVLIGQRCILEAEFSDVRLD